MESGSFPLSLDLLFNTSIHSRSLTLGNHDDFVLTGFALNSTMMTRSVARRMSLESSPQRGLQQGAPLRRGSDRPQGGADDGGGGGGGPAPAARSQTFTVKCEWEKAFGTGPLSTLLKSRTDHLVRKVTALSHVGSMLVNLISLQRLQTQPQLFDLQPEEVNLQQEVFNFSNKSFFYGILATLCGGTGNYRGLDVDERILCREHRSAISVGIPGQANMVLNHPFYNALSTDLKAKALTEIKTQTVPVLKKFAGQIINMYMREQNSTIRLR